MRQQPGGGTIKEYAWPLGPGPAQNVQPARQAKSHLRFGDVAVTEIQSDLGRMFPPLLASPISWQSVEIRDAQLVRECLHNLGGNGYRIVEKRPEIAHCRQLQRETEAVVFPATYPDLRKIVIVQIEKAAQLVRAWRRGIASVILMLRGSEKLIGMPVA